MATIKYSNLLKYPIYGVIGFIGLLACSKSSSTPSPPTNTTTPILTISGAGATQTASPSTIQFSVSLSLASATAITVNYATADGTATAPHDYTNTSGTLTIPANTKTASINVPISGDSLRQPNISFTLNLSNPQNCTLGNSSVTGTIITQDGTYLPTDTSGYDAPASYAGYTLAWSDEFDSSAINTKVWDFDQGNNNGWGNGELENYTNRIQNAFESYGNLIIEARQESLGGYNYTSARMTTENSGVNFTYGRYDIRAKLPTTQGIWPALWMLGNNINSGVSWPACGETDIMENVGAANVVYGTFHWQGNSGESSYPSNNSYTLPTGSFSQQFHVYSLIWRQDSLFFLVDNNAYVKASRQDLSGGTYPFDNPFFFIFNVAVGGNWPGNPPAGTPFPQRMFVDYVRYFKQN